jgi:ABC-2 type transport system permease protein
MLDIALKDLTRSFRSLFAVGMMFVAPVLITGLIYLAFGGLSSGKTDLPVTTVAVVNLDQPPADSPISAGEEIAGIFSDPSVSSWLKMLPAADEAAARAAVDRREADVAVILPANLSQAFIEGGASARIQLIQDPTQTIGPAVVRDMIQSMLDGNAGARVALQTSADLNPTLNSAANADLLTRFTSWYIDFQRSLFHSTQAAVITENPASNTGTQQGSLQNILAMTVTGMMIFFGFYTGAYSMTSIVNEDEQGTLARLFTTPTARTAILGGKFLAVFLTVTVQTLVMLLIGRLLFHVQWGEPLSVILSVLGQVVAATGLGVLIISLVRNSRQEGPVLGGGLTLLGMLGGLFTVGVEMPAGFQTVNLLTPQGWALRAWKLTVTGAQPQEILLPLIVLLAAGIIFFLLGTRIFRRRYA